MTKKEIFDIESSNTDRIHLFLEGTFWIAYEKSAFQFVRSVRSYRVKKKYVKNMEREMVSLGFPASALDEVTAGLEKLEASEKRIVFKAPETFSPQEFDQWKAVIPAAESTSRSVAGSAVASADASLIVERVRNFDIASKTPVECLFFVAELKEHIARIYPSYHAVHAASGI